MLKIEATIEERIILVKMLSIFSTAKNYKRESWMGDEETIEEMENLCHDMLHGKEIPKDTPYNEPFERSRKKYLKKIWS